MDFVSINNLISWLSQQRKQQVVFGTSYRLLSQVLQVVLSYSLPSTWYMEAQRKGTNHGTHMGRGSFLFVC